MSVPAEDVSKEIFVNNLNYQTVPNTLGQVFSRYGHVTKARVITRLFRGEEHSQGYGFVIFETVEEQQKAIAGGRIEIDGRNVVVRAARPPVLRPRVEAFLGGIGENTTEEQIKAVFPKAVSVTIFKPRRERRGFAFVKFASNEELMEAIKDVREATIGSTTGVKVSIAKSRPRRFPRRTSRRPTRGARRGRGKRAPRQGASRAPKAATPPPANE